MTGSILGNCFSEFRFSARRLETLPAYLVPEEAESLAAFRARRPVPERSLRTNDYLREVAEDVLAGRERLRIRVVDEPLSPYIQWELERYSENQVAGEQILITVRNAGDEKAQRKLAQLAGDFWFFDAGEEDERAVLMEYDHQGGFAGAQLGTAGVLHDCRKMWNLAVQHAVPLNEYAARRRRIAAA